MNYITFADGTKVPVHAAYSLNNIVYVADNEEAAVDFSRSLTREKLSHVEFSDENGSAYGVFENLMHKVLPMRQDNEDGTVNVILNLREATELELRVLELEESQSVQDGAIEEIAEIVAEG